MTLTLNDEQWDLIRRELPRNSELRSRVTDLKDDAMTWGESEGEFDPAEVKQLTGHFEWLDEILRAQQEKKP